MFIHKVQRNTFNTSFGAGSVLLQRVSSRELMAYDAIKRIAEEDNLDLSITKWKESKYLPSSHGYTVIATQDIKEFPFIAHGVGCTLTSKKSQAPEVSAKIYDSVIKAVKSLAENVKKQTGIKPEFLKYLKK